MKTARRYDVAISFAGEDREYAAGLADALVSRGLAVFYDASEKAALFGKDLYTYLSDVYQDQAQYCVMFLSKHYAQKAWTNHERRAAQARAFREQEEYILPVRLDDTEIPGILPTIGYLKWPPENSDTIADAILVKLGKDPRAFVLLSPETRKEIRETMLKPDLPATDKSFLVGLIAFKDLDGQREKRIDELMAIDQHAAKRIALKDTRHQKGDPQTEKLNREQQNDKRRRDEIRRELDKLDEARRLIMAEMKTLNDRSLAFLRKIWA